jgi:hypothetical protein
MGTATSKWRISNRWISSFLIVLALIAVVAGALRVGFHVATLWRLATYSLRVPILAYAILLSALILWTIPKWHCARLSGISDDVRFDKENESRKTLAQIIGGLLVIGSLYATQETFRLSQDTFRLSEESQIADRYTKGISLLGDKESVSRLGGIYALQQLALRSADYDGPIMFTLASYVRMYAPWPPMGNQEKRRAEIITILGVLGRRTTVQRARESDEVSLAETDLHGLVLDGFDLENTNLRQAHLEGATLRNTSLKNAFLLGTHLEDALVASWDLTQDQIDDACGNAGTKLPASLKKPAGWLAKPPRCREPEE